MESSIAVASLVFFVAFITLFLRPGRRGQLPLPPGPPGSWPVVGHALVFPKEKHWEQFHTWCKELRSDIIHLDLLGTSVIVLDGLKAAHDLLEKKSSVYSGRPRMPMLKELMGWDFNLGTMDYGPCWRRHRRIFETSFNRGSLHQYESHQIRACRQLLNGLLHSPEGFLDHFHLLAGSVILGVVYGIQAAGPEDQFIAVLEEGIQPALQAAIPGRFLVDIFPAMKYIPEWMPFASFQKFARRARSASDEMQNMPFNETKRMMAGGGCPASIVADRLQNIDPEQDVVDQEETIKNVAATAYTAGVDNVIATLAGFVLGMLSNPDARHKAQAEVDSTISAGHLPTLADMESLPYLTALTMEAFRFSISSPIGAPHKLDADDEYNGFRLKKGAIVLANSWAILHDENTFPEPFAFRPERFMQQGFDKMDADASEIAAAFGFGRRICPGRHFAFSTVWLAIASIVTSFEISNAVDENGNPIVPDVVYTQASSVLPLPFKCKISPRSKYIRQFAL